MNAEIMAKQKEEGVNMFGGCIPTVIQLPLLFAFFTMMTRVVELRQAHWFWLHDLSASDPYKILPIIMVVTQFLVQFYTPSPGVGPAAATHDGVHDAAVLWLHYLELRLRPGALLGRWEISS